jgi:hypothetical protein
LLSFRCAAVTHYFIYFHVIVSFDAGSGSDAAQVWSLHNHAAALLLRRIKNDVEKVLPPRLETCWWKST